MRGKILGWHGCHVYHVDLVEVWHIYHFSTYESHNNNSRMPTTRYEYQPYYNQGYHYQPPQQQKSSCPYAKKKKDSDSEDDNNEELITLGLLMVGLGGVMMVLFRGMSMPSGQVRVRREKEEGILRFLGRNIDTHSLSLKALLLFFINTGWSKVFDTWISNSIN